MAEKIVVGTPVIINHWDRPCARLIAIVESMETTSYSDEGPIIRSVSGRYLFKASSQERCRNNLLLVTPLSHFGVRVALSGNTYCVEKTGESYATYQNGMRREWQDGQAEWLDMDREAFALLKTYLEKFPHC